MHKVLVDRLGGLSLPRKSVVRLTDCPNLIMPVYRGHKTTKQQHKTTKQQQHMLIYCFVNAVYTLEIPVFYHFACSQK